MLASPVGLAGFDHGQSSSVIKRNDDYNVSNDDKKTTNISCSNLWKLTSSKQK